MDKDFQQKSLTVTTKEGVHDLCAEFGVELTAEEVDAFLVQLGAMLAEEQSSELSEDDLDNTKSRSAFLRNGIFCLSRTPGFVVRIIAPPCRLPCHCEEAVRRGNLLERYSEKRNPNRKIYLRTSTIIMLFR